MALGKKKKKGDAADGAGGGGKDAKEKGGKSNLVPAIIVAVGLIVGGKMMGGGSGSAAPAAPAETTTTTTPEGPVVKVDPITLNMADGRFVRVGLGFQMAYEEGGGGGGGHGAPAEPDTTDAAGHYAKALDIVIEVLGGKKYEELVDPAGREHAKDEIVAELEHAYHGEIEDLYFTEFVLQ